MDLLAHELLGVDAQEAEMARDGAEREELESAEALRLAARALGNLVREREDVAKDLMCGVVALVSVKGTASRLLVDMKSGATGAGRPLVHANDDCPRDKKVDIKLVFEAEEQFRGVLSRRLDFAKLMQLGQVQVEGALRAKMKLMALADVGKRLEREAQARRNEAAMAAISWEDEPLRGSFRGMLDKKSEWLKNWKERFFALDWDPFNRPTLAYAVRQNDPPRSVIELHSSCTVEARATTRRDKLHQAAFAIVDRRSGEDLLVLCAPSEEARAVWLRNIKAAITARARARTQAAVNASVAGDSHPPTPRGFATTIPKDATRRSHASRSAEPPAPASEPALPEAGSLAPKLQAELVAQLVATGVESHTAFILRKIGWRLAPLFVIAGMALPAFARRATGAVASAADAVSASLSTVHSALASSSALAAIWDAVLGHTPAILNRLPTVTAPSVPASFWQGSALILVSGLVARTLCKSPFFELARRRIKVLSLAARLITDLKITDLKTQDMPPVHADATWRVTQRAIAEQVYAHALSLGGLWVKVAQHMGARADAMPEGIVNVLSRLQDEVPPTPFAELKPHLERELGQRIEDVFEDFQEIPIAAASIGQVHTGRLRKDGAAVVIKVQHPGVDRLLRQDVQNMGVIATWISIIDPKFSDLARDVLDHWRKNVLKELDFLNETENMREVGANLAACDEVYASVPTAIPHLCTNRVITMRFVRGSKVTDFAGLANIGVAGLGARSTLADDICNAFAHQIFIGGLANADPHPGNVLVARREDVAHGEIARLPPTTDTSPARPVPVILDFGLALRIPDKVRLGLARLVLAASQLDAGGMFEGGELLGIRLTRENLLDDFGGFQHMLRDTAPPEESRQQTVARIELEKEKWERQNFEIPIESFPPELILMVRSLDLVRALCSSLEVRQPFIRTLASWAHRALLERFPQGPERPLASVRGAGKAVSELEDKLYEAIRANADQIVGIQVAVIAPGQHCGRISIAEGRLSHVDRRAVSRDSLFPGMALAQAATQICAHRALAARRVDISPSAEDLLSGDLSRLAFDPTAVPENFDTKTAGDWTSNLAFARRNAKHEAPGVGEDLSYELSHMAFAWGWGVMGLLQESSQRDAEVSSLACEAQRQGLCFGLSSPTEAESLLERGQLAQSSFPVERLLEQHGIRDVGSMGNAEALQSGDANPLSMISEAAPSLKGKEFWADPRITNIPRLAAACLPSMNVLCTADALAIALHSLDGDQVAAKRVWAAAASSDGTDPFAAGRLGLRTYNFSDKDGHTQSTAIGQIAFGGNALLYFPEHSLTLCVLVNQLSMDAAPTQACLNAVYQALGLSPEGDF